MKMKIRFSTLFIACLLSIGTARADNSLEQALRQAIANVKATIGIAVITDKGDTVTVNNEEHYPLMSVMKLHQALYMAHYLSEHGRGMDYKIKIEKADLKPNTYSPLRDRYPEGVTLSVGNLLTYTLQQSDNNACDLLFRLTGGPRATDAYLRRYWQARQFAITATEEDMHRDLTLCQANYSTPLEATRLIHQLYTKNAEADANLQFIRQTLFDCRTGLQRIPAGITGQSVKIAHKTGTSDQDPAGRWIGINDVAYVQFPDGRDYSLAIFIKNSSEDYDDNERVIAHISEIVFRFITSTAS